MMETTNGNLPQVAPRWPLYLALGIALVIWCGVDVQRRGRIDPNRPEVHRTDFTCYTEAGRAFFDGRNPYEVTNPRGWGYAYPPLFAILLSPLSLLDSRVQVTVWFFISVAVVWGLYCECAKLFRAFAPSELQRPELERATHWIVAAAMAVAALPLLNNLQRGQADSLKLYLLILGVRLSLTGASWQAWLGGGCALAAAIVLKITPLLPVGFLLFILLARVVLRRASDPRGMARIAAVTSGVVCGAVMFLLFVPATLVGWQANLKHLDEFTHRKLVKANDYQAADATGNTRTIRNQSLSNSIIRLGSYIDYQFLGGPDDRIMDGDWRAARVMAMDSPSVQRALLAARGGAVLLLLGVGLICVWREDVLGQVATIAMAGAAALVVSPISRGSYYAELAPGVLILPLWLLAHKMKGVSLLMAWGPVVMVVAHYLLLSFTGRIGLLGIGTAIWYAAALLSVAVCGHGGRHNTHNVRPNAAEPAPHAARFAGRAA